MSLEGIILKHKKVLEILSKQPDDTDEVKAVKKLWSIYNDLVNLCDEKNLPNGGHLKRLKELCEKVENAVNFPLYYHKNVIALCGQFSSGKTSMINSFLKNDVLPTSIEPTTALNTYVVYDDKDENDTLYIRNHFSGRTKIDEDLYDFVTHSFSNEYHQNVRSMIRYVSLHTKKLNFQNIALLDTPGYTGESSDLSLEEDDKNMAIEGIKGADYVIWVIDITNGTIKEDDINFLQDYASDKPKIIVLNKADLLTKSKAQEVYDNIKSTLEDEGLDNIEIYLYSSKYPEDFQKTTGILFKLFRKADEKIKDDGIGNIKELFESFKNYYININNNLYSETKILNVSKMHLSMKGDLSISDINFHLNIIKKNRYAVEEVLKTINILSSKCESVIKKAIANNFQSFDISMEDIKNIIIDENSNFQYISAALLRKENYIRYLPNDDYNRRLKIIFCEKLALSYMGMKDEDNVNRYVKILKSINKKDRDAYDYLSIIVYFYKTNYTVKFIHIVNNFYSFKK